jgi:hypothetical protein
MATDQSVLKAAVLRKLDPGEIAVGQYSFDDVLELRVYGSANKAEPKLIAATCDLPVMAILALVCTKSKISGARILDLIRQAAVKEERDKIADALDFTNGALQTVKQELIAKLPKRQTEGPFTGRIASKSSAKEVTPRIDAGSK